MNAKDAILYLYDKGLLNIDAIMKNKDSIMQELDNATENKPQHDPCRLFKKGDKVRVVEWNGRKNIRAGMIGEVVSDEFNCKVELAIDGWPNGVYYQACFLELVAPVEELELFYVDYITTDDDDDLDDNPRWCVKYRKYDDIVSIFYRNVFESPEKTRAAAEAECDRLNEKHRKEQNQ